MRNACICTFHNEFVDEIHFGNEIGQPLCFLLHFNKTELERKVDFYDF